MQTPLVLVLVLVPVLVPVTGFSVTSVRWVSGLDRGPAAPVRRIEFPPGLPDVQADDKFFVS